MVNKSIKNKLKPPFSIDEEGLVFLSNKIRKSVFEICLNTSNGHIGGSSGAVELLTTLYFGNILRYNLSDPKDSHRDRVLIRGHLGPVRYSIFSELNFISKHELKNYRTFGSILQGHEDHRLVPGVDLTPSGSLGMILSFGIGSAVVAKQKKEDFRTFVFLGDGEEQEGNISEAARHAARLKLNNLIVIIDLNGKQLSDFVLDVDTSNLKKIWEGYGWEVITLKDGHDVKSIKTTYMNAIYKLKKGKPVVILAHTVKGIGLSGSEKHFSGFHTMSTCSKDVVLEAIESISENIKKLKPINLGGLNNKLNKNHILDEEKFNKLNIGIKPSVTGCNLGKSQVEYFKKLKLLNLGVKYPMFFLTADVTRKDFVDQIRLRDFLLYDNVGLREQHLLAYAHGVSLTMPEARIIINSFDAFVYRGFDQLNSIALGGSNVIVLGDYSGLTNSKNGSTHQSSAQSRALISIPKITFLEPWNSKDLFGCFNWALGKSRGLVYIRLHAGNTLDSTFDNKYIKNNLRWYKVYDNNEPDMVIVSSGLTTGYCIDAAKKLNLYGIKIRVINIVNHKSLSKSFLSELVKNKPVLTVYNGSSAFLQSNISSVVMQYGLNIPLSIHGIGFDIGTTGSLDDLLKYYKLNTDGIIKVVKKILKK